jgi:hypothetical protein
MLGGFRVFDQVIERELDKSRMGLPCRSMASVFRLENHDYQRIRPSWREARRAVKYEYRFLRRLEQAPDLDAELIVISDENYENDDPPLQGLDPGVAGTVLALAAMGCFTITSCNGGCFGHPHHEDYPLVGFYAGPEDAEPCSGRRKSRALELGTTVRTY